MTVLITLTLAGSDVGPFNLYSDADGYTTAFETGVSRAALLAGYTSTIVPEGSTEVLARSTGVCSRDLYMPIEGAPTTTTTTSSTTTTTTTLFPGTGYYYNLQQLAFNCMGGIGTCTGNIGGNFIGYSTVPLVVGDYYNQFGGQVWVITGTTSPQIYDYNISSWAGSNYANCGDATQC